MIFDYLPRDQDHISNQCLPRRGKDRDRGGIVMGKDGGTGMLFFPRVLICFGSLSLLADPGEARSCSTNTVVIHSFADYFLPHGSTAPPKPKQLEMVLPVIR